MSEEVDEERLIAKASAWWAERLEVVAAQKAFQSALAAHIKAALKTSPSYVELSVDYDPSPLLIAALADAGIECRGFLFSARGLLPEKTRMIIRSKGGSHVIRIKEGYGGLDRSLAKND